MIYNDTLNDYERVTNSCTIYIYIYIYIYTHCNYYYCFVIAFLIIIGNSSAYFYFHWYLKRDNIYVNTSANINTNNGTIIY